MTHCLNPDKNPVSKFLRSHSRFPQVRSLFFWMSPECDRPSPIPTGLSISLLARTWQKMASIAIINKTSIRSHVMKTMNVSLPDTMRDYIEEQVKTRGYGSVSEYMRDLIRQDQKRNAQEQIETLLLAGLESGTATPMSDRDWAEIRQAVQDRLKNT
ncbi:type II toxin-antitoxin system ParD family antitoxin [Desertifilum tharense]|nr:type II toxin-antitoxin system ParD family antitoxin [Desertifilum tharense]